MKDSSKPYHLYGSPKDFPTISQLRTLDASDGMGRAIVEDELPQDIGLPVGFVATIYNQMFKEVQYRPILQRHYTPLQDINMSTHLPAHYIPPTSRMNEKIKELDANITKLREMLKNDTKIRATNSGMDSLLNEGSGSMLRSNDQGSPYNGERKRRRTGSDDEDIPGPASYIRSQFRRQDSSSSGEEEKEVPAPFFRPAEQMSPVSKKRHFSFGGPPEIMQPHDANPVRGGLGLGASSASGTSHPGLGSVNMDGGDVFDNYRRQRSTRYHKAIAAAFQAKMLGPGTDDKLCYICHQPGHFAKHCKFGIS